MWSQILQEVAAARHVLMTCYSAEIDGDAFAFGLSALKDITSDPHLQNHISSIVYLIKYVHLRPKRAIGRSDGFSLDIRPLAELAIMYKDCEATDRRDKVYALLNMGSDNNASKSLLPDYSLPWKDVFDRLIRFYAGEQVCVQTWDDEDIAVIKGKGCVLGVVSTEGSPQDTWYFRDLPPLTKEGDIVCLLQGASEATIIRAYDDYCAVVAIGLIPKHASPSSGPSPMVNWEVLDKWHDLLQSVTVYPRDFFLVWDRQKLGGIEKTANGSRIIEYRSMPRSS
ncbi:hypothetical protein ANOM_000703 [Aspergillus nomiae NRRL 13137]|uniref:Heterokaryon incompatibility domain-containing protein n=1 Tax=Aspergillus nomiae NRRL (strain ATCC 15546 / NRRL 13137 / CBS 260.88 / M93) TaxID=1509407 RepID=A0A0L1JGK5_ASPN3|nr:uncharacterized protein ANOM_000703 [Aspergillus nomiae NRRL 13137]KNG90910.1 hypothetical protein ANOM_000703 [Aspergillus nomiae NRRL 13137]